MMEILLSSLLFWEIKLTVWAGILAVTELHSLALKQSCGHRKKIKISSFCKQCRLQTRHKGMDKSPKEGKINTAHEKK